MRGSSSVFMHSRIDENLAASCTYVNPNVAFEGTHTRERAVSCPVGNVESSCSSTNYRGFIKARAWETAKH